VSIGLWGPAKSHHRCAEGEIRLAVCDLDAVFITENYGLDLKKSIVLLRGDAVLAR
jgi:hypothetical protein